MSVLILFLFSSCPIYSKELSFDQVYSSVKKHYPQILEALDNVEEAKMRVKEAYGAFDLKLNAKADVRTRGYYDGRSSDIKLEKPLRVFNSKIYTGHRVSRGEYPDYEGKMDTLSDGESRLGVSLSLLRDRDIDEKRFKLYKSKLKLSSTEAKLLKTKIKLRKLAAISYWDWQAKGQSLKVYEELLNIARKRDSAIRKRIAKGDLAKIYQTENRQYIVKRESQVIEAKADFMEASLLLSLFYRDSDGFPLLMNSSDLPVWNEKYRALEKKELEKDLEKLTQLSPELKVMSNELEEFKLEQKIGENSLSPQIDISFEMAKDTGDGSKSLSQTENRAMIQIEIPLERRLGRGKIEAARAKSQAQKRKMKLFKETMSTELTILFYQINALQKLIENTQEQVDLTTTLQKAETQKFYQGASDFFVVNLREQNLIDAKIKNVKSVLKYQKALAKYKASIFEY